MRKSGVENRIMVVLYDAAEGKSEKAKGRWQTSDVKREMGDGTRITAAMSD